MFDQIISKYGATAKSKLSSPAITGAPEDNIRAPLEELIAALAEAAGQQPGWVTLVGESTLSALGTRPDYAVTVRNALTGFIELKAPGKGADPRKFSDLKSWLAPAQLETTRVITEHYIIKIMRHVSVAAK